MCKILVVNCNKNNLKKYEKKFKKVLEGKEKCVSLHSQNNGNEGLNEERGFAQFFERMIQAKSER